MTPPRLTRRDLAADLERIYTGDDREHFLVAFHGMGDEDHLNVGGAAVRVVPVRGELELRRRLLDLGDDDRVAFLVPWTTEMPIDLQGASPRAAGCSASGATCAWASCSARSRSTRPCTAARSATTCWPSPPATASRSRPAG